MGLMGTSELFNRFMNEKGLPVLLDNIEIRGIDELKLMVNDWLKELQQEKQMAMQQAQQQQNPLDMKNKLDMAKIQQKGQEMQMKEKEHQMQFKIDVERLKQDQMKLMSEVAIAKDSNVTQRMKAESERFSKQVDLAMKKKDMHHRHFKEAIELHHTIKTTPKNMEARH